MRAQLAELAVEVGVPGEAKAEFERAGRLFDQLQQPSDRRYRILAELSVARAELAEGAPEAAVVSAWRGSAPLQKESMRGPLRINIRAGFSGIHSRLPERAYEAEAAYRRAIDLSEHRLDTLQGFRERAQLMLGCRPSLSRSRRAFVEPRGPVRSVARLGMVSSR